MRRYFCRTLLSVHVSGGLHFPQVSTMYFGGKDFLEAWATNRPRDKLLRSEGLYTCHHLDAVIMYAALTQR
jgi:hypothetical protein